MELLAKRIRFGVFTILTVVTVNILIVLASDTGLARGLDTGSLLSTTDLLVKVIPTVVSIHTHRDISLTNRSVNEIGFSPKIERAEGSGFIVSTDGFIATNKHVVHGAYSVSVSLSSGQELKARIVWESALIDVAFLKVEANAPLQAATLASEDALPIGRRVVAVGNPLGLGISASAGIVSAVNRNLDQTPYDSYVQTDAAVNDGNSGGPLFDLSGIVVGMNSIHWTIGKDQGSQGLGFAIPASDIAFLIEQLKTTGRIRCGTIGVQGQSLTQSMAEAVNHQGSAGIIVAAIEPGSIGDRAGLTVGDIIQSFDGKDLREVSTFNRAVCQGLGHDVDMVVWRRSLFLNVRLNVRDARNDMIDLSELAARMAPRFASTHDLGLTLASIDDKTRTAYHLSPEAKGFVVADVAVDSEAYQSDLARGDVIERLQWEPLTGRENFDRMLVEQANRGRRHVICLVKARSGDRWITLPVRLNGSFHPSN